jgi:ribosomal protein S18 acetylase RimI-like enzyme
MHIRSATLADLASLEEVATAQGARHEARYFETCLAEQEKGTRAVYVAEDPSQTIPSQTIPPQTIPPQTIIGYVQLIWSPLYLPFRRLKIPEIQDLNVIPAMRQRGMGKKLVEACEVAAREKLYHMVGIGVGLHTRFGAAQRLYVRMGYIPDGTGVCYDDQTVTAGELRAVDDLLTLKLIKDL